MKTMILAAVAALALSAGIASAQTLPLQSTVHHQGPYDNTGSGPQSTGLEGGGG
jgi:hypothetical protein